MSHAELEELLGDQHNPPPEASWKAYLRSYVFTFLVFAVLSLVHSLVASQEVQRDPRPRTILALGDSLTFGIGGSGRGYPELLASLIRNPVINAGSPGETSVSARNLFIRQIQESDARVLILCLGINDFLRDVPVRQSAEALGAIVAAAQAAKMEILLLAVGAPGKEHAHPLYAQLGRKYGVAVDDSSLVSVQANPLFKADPVHLNRDGYARLAENLAATLASLEMLD